MSTIEEKYAEAVKLYAETTRAQKDIAEVVGGFVRCNYPELLAKKRKLMTRIEKRKIPETSTLCYRDFSLKL